MKYRKVLKETNYCFDLGNLQYYEVEFIQYSSGFRKVTVDSITVMEGNTDMMKPSWENAEYWLNHYFIHREEIEKNWIKG